jgi:hypothetical protein
MRPGPRLAPRRPLLALLLAACAGGALAQQSAAELKAQVLVKVLRFVEWPPGQLVEGQALQVCLFDEGPLALQLQALDGLAVNSNPMRVRPRGARVAGGCHVALGTAPALPPGILLVGEEALQLDKGVMLSLAVEDGRVVFDIDLDAARRAGIGFSARLLRLARFVRKA